MQDGLKRVLDYSDYLAAPEDGKRYEIVGGDLLVTPAPRPVHQRVLLRLASPGDVIDETWFVKSDGKWLPEAQQLKWKPRMAELTARCDAPAAIRPIETVSL